MKFMFNLHRVPKNLADGFVVFPSYDDAFIVASTITVLFGIMHVELVSYHGCPCFCVCTLGHLIVHFVMLEFGYGF
jgi:hypothetical protein